MLLMGQFTINGDFPYVKLPEGNGMLNEWLMDG